MDIKDLMEQKVKELDAMTRYVKNFFITVNTVILYFAIVII
jgi:hypothetical protein